MKLKISSSILVLLLCLGAFHFNQVQAATCDASRTGCATCDGTSNTAKCLTCNDNYYLDSDKCNTCADTSKYFPTTGTTASDCTSCTTTGTCKVCNIDGTCKTCPTNYVLGDAGKSCKACSDTTKYLPSGKTLDTECVSCGTGCKTCSIDGTKCLTCIDNYYLANDKCNTCADTSKYFPKTGTTASDCTSCMNNCKVCNIDGTCKTCADNYVLAGDAKSCGACSDTTKYLPVGKTKDADCVSCGTGSKTCSVDGTKSLTCTDGYYLESDKCKTCADPTQYLPAGKTKASECVAGPDNCAQTKSDGTKTCKTCADNYGLSVDSTTCGTCTDKFKYVPLGKTAIGDCAECGLGCSECNVDGTCKTCEAGRYVKDGKCTSCPSNCKTCGTDGKCTACNTKFFVSSGACKTCGTGCNACDATGKCTGCDAPYYLSSDACKSCGTGCSACDATGKCTTCASGYGKNTDGVCVACSAGCTACGTDGVCTTCGSGYVEYGTPKTCVSCGNGCVACSTTDGKAVACTKCDYNNLFVAASSSCKACDDKKYVLTQDITTASCTATPDGKFYDTTASPAAFTACADAQCKTCDGANLGQCTVCKDGYNVVSGTCVSKTAPAAEARSGSTTASIRYDMDYDTYTSYGGANYFAATASKALKVDIGQIEVTGTKIGSVIVLFRVFSTGSTKPADIALAINTAIAQGAMSSVYGSTIVMDSDAVVLLPNGCPSGQYYDSANYVCKDCTDDICGKKKSKVGAIVGGVLGGIALIIIIGVLIWKKDVLLSKMRSPKVGSAQYNGLAAKSPAVKEDV